MWGEWTIKGLAAWRELTIGWFASLKTERVVVTFEEIQIRAAGESASATALVRFAAISGDGEELRYLQNRLTWIIQKSENSWKIVHQHTSVPINFETMKGILKKAARN